MDSLFTKTVRAGNITHFVEGGEKPEEIHYDHLVLPSKDDASQRTRKSLVVFDNAAEKLHGAIAEAIQNLK